MGAGVSHLAPPVFTYSPNLAPASADGRSRSARSAALAPFRRHCEPSQARRASLRAVHAHCYPNVGAKTSIPDDPQALVSFPPG